MIGPSISGGQRMRSISVISLLLAILIFASCSDSSARRDVDTLIKGGLIFDGTGDSPYVADIAISEDRIVFIGDASAHQVSAHSYVDAGGKYVTPGFIDMHSHAELDKDYGRDGTPYLHQGITTVVLGVDGDGDPDVSSNLSGWEESGIGLNALTYVGHGSIRSAVMGRENREPTSEEIAAMHSLVRTAMEQGAFGLSTGLFYVPGSFATTDEVIALAKTAAEYPGAIYDTHDRDLGAAYNGIGYDASVLEGIRIGEESGTRVIFSHFNLQGAKNRGRADVGARYVNEARDRGVDVWAAQHPYTATQSSLRAYTIPTWAAAGGDKQMIARFDDPIEGEQISNATYEMLAIRGGAEKLLLVDERPDLNGKTLAEFANQSELEVHEAVQKILRDGNAKVMNLDLYDHANTRRLANEPWMMTCTDGRTPRPDQPIAHPRTFGAFPMKYRMFVREEGILTPQQAIRGFSGLAADFLSLSDRGYLREGYYADIAVIDPVEYRDHATYDEPQRLSSGIEILFINGQKAITEERATGILAGRPIRRPGTETGNVQ